MSESDCPCTDLATIRNPDGTVVYICRRCGRVSGGTLVAPATERCMDCHRPARPGHITCGVPECDEAARHVWYRDKAALEMNHGGLHF